MATIEVDNRGLEPPDPMVRILKALSSADPEDDLFALMDREPLLLYPELERRGYEWDIEPSGEHFALRIRRAGRQ
jgi:uncharacterized protein (DUF2249 family)